MMSDSEFRMWEVTGDHDKGQLLKKTQVAKILGLSVRTVNTILAEGKLQSIRVSERAVRIDPADLRRYIDSRRITK